jgi:hypothetical protein
MWATAAAVARLAKIAARSTLARRRSPLCSCAAISTISTEDAVAITTVGSTRRALRLPLRVRHTCCPT